MDIRYNNKNNNTLIYVFYKQRQSKQQQQENTPSSSKSNKQAKNVAVFGVVIVVVAVSKKKNPQTRNSWKNMPTATGYSHEQTTLKQQQHTYTQIYWQTHIYVYAYMTYKYTAQTDKRSYNVINKCSGNWNVRGAHIYSYTVTLVCVRYGLRISVIHTTRSFHTANTCWHVRAACYLTSVLLSYTVKRLQPTTTSRNDRH